MFGNLKICNMTTTYAMYGVVRGYLHTQWKKAIGLHHCSRHQNNNSQQETLEDLLLNTLCTQAATFSYTPMRSPHTYIHLHMTSWKSYQISLLPNKYCKIHSQERNDLSLAQESVSCVLLHTSVRSLCTHKHTYTHIHNTMEMLTNPLTVE